MGAMNDFERTIVKHYSDGPQAVATCPAGHEMFEVFIAQWDDIDDGKNLWRWGCTSGTTRTGRTTTPGSSPPPASRTEGRCEQPEQSTANTAPGSPTRVFLLIERS